MKTILVVDDDDSIRETLVDIISYRFSEHSVNAASDGLAAKEFIEAEKKPDLIILDWLMPRMDGKTFLREVIDLQYPEIPVIITSAGLITNGSGDRPIARKPFDFEALIETIRLNLK
jgi:two-component system phosphate regulon response regulator PhoB